MTALPNIGECRFREGEPVSPPFRLTGDWSFQETDALSGEGAAILFDLDRPYGTLEMELEVRVDEGLGIGGKLGSYPWQLGAERGGVSALKHNMEPIVARDLHPLLKLGTWQTVRGPPRTFQPDGA